MGELDGRFDGLPGGAGDAASRYRVEVLPWAAVEPGGVVFRDRGESLQLGWDRVLHALAAHVGEPEGVSTVVFDLLVERKHTECLVFRFDADPGEAAQAVAQTLVEQIGRERCSRSLQALAAEGVPTRAYADLEALAAGSLEDLGL
jgi:hypothetical protein